MDVCADQCLKHGDEVVKYFCTVHESLGCSACIIIDHRNCKGVEYIPSVSADLIDSVEYKDFEMALTELESRSKNIISKTEENITKIEDDYAQTMQDVKGMRMKENDKLDQWENEIKTEAIAHKSEETERTTLQLNESRKVYKDIQQIKLDISTLKKKHLLCKLFIAIKTAKTHLDVMSEKLEQEDTIWLTRLQSGTGKLEKMKNTKVGLGKLAGTSLRNANVMGVPNEESRIQYLTDIYVRSETDRELLCQIDGFVALPGNKLVMIDRYNIKVKLADTVQKRVLSEIKLSSAPAAITMIDSQQVAILLYAENGNVPDRILIAKISRHIFADRMIRFTNCVAKAISYYKNGFLLVSNDFNMYRIEMDGRVKLSCTLANSLRCLSNIVLSVDYDTDCICITGILDNSRTGLKTQAIGMTLDDNMSSLHITNNVECNADVQITDVQNNNLFLLGNNSVSMTKEIFETKIDQYKIPTANLLTYIPPAVSKVNVLITQEHGIYHPCSIRHDLKTGRLYVGIKECNNIKVFQLIHS